MPLPFATMAAAVFASSLVSMAVQFTFCALQNATILGVQCAAFVREINA
jgi:hypothetical protein